MKKLVSWSWIQYLLPLVIWFTLLILPYLGRDDYSNLPLEDQQRLIDYHRRFITGIVTSNLALLCIFYIHAFLIYPLINKKKTGLYALSFIVMAAGYWCYWAYLRPNPFEGMPSRPWPTRVENTQRQNFGPRAEAFGANPGDSLNKPNEGRDTFSRVEGFGNDSGRYSRSERPEVFAKDSGQTGQGDRNAGFGDGSAQFRQGGPRGGNGFRFSRGPRYMYLDLVSPLMAILLSIGYRIIIDNRAKQQLLKERETAHLKSELTFLRSQISPHFMFNVLNNLVALARKKSEKLEPAIVSLSQLMRYMLYESDDYKVSLSKELDYINSYISLQMLRFGNSVKTNIEVKNNVDLYMIEPMLLIPFVENAFKHGTGMLEVAVINITLSVDEQTRLMHFSITNDVGAADDSKDSNSGIGIANVRRRLAILYPDKHDLSISNTPTHFTVDLNIYLTE